MKKKTLKRTAKLTPYDPEEDTLRSNPKQTVQRYRMLMDDSGHAYVIPADLQDEFEHALGEDDFDDRFGQYRLPYHPGCLTFTDPKKG